MADTELDALMAQLEGALDRSAQDTPRPEDEALIARVVAEHQAETARPGPTHGWARLLAVAGAAAVAASAATWALVGRPPPQGSVPAELPEQPSDKLALTSGAAVPGAELDVREGRSCLTLAEEVTACAAEASALRVVQGGNDLRLRVERGRVVARLARQRPGHTFGFVTPHGQVIATGTTLSVEVSATDTVFRVLEGSVVVAVTGRTLRLTGPSEARSTLLEPRTLEEPERTRDLALLRVLPTPAATQDAGAPPDAQAQKPAAELLEAARSARAAGRYAEAAARYEELMRAHPGSGEARAALLSLADLQLSRLGDPASALRSYEAYLRGGGGLVPEARYGKIRALSALGRATEERAEIERFLADYPASAYSATLARRLRGGAARDRLQ